MPQSPVGEHPVWCAYCVARDLSEVKRPLWELEGDDFIVVCDACREKHRLKVRRKFMD